MTPTEIRDTLAQRLARIEERIRDACHRASRRREDITLIAVTKTVDIPVARMLPEFGIFDLGESRPQEIWRKADAMKDLPIRWHMIGHMQRNKVERTAPLLHLIHSVDSVRLYHAIAATGIAVPVLLQLNGSGEEQKNGFDFDELRSLREVFEVGSLPVRGLMTMAAYSDDPESARPVFRALAQLRDEFRLTWTGPNFRFETLSMGMSGDFEPAIEEGATQIRLGSVLFEGLESPPESEAV